MIEANGTTNEVTGYSFIHHMPYEGLNYFRSRQVNFDGTEEYHRIIQAINRPEDVSLKINTYPNHLT